MLLIEVSDSTLEFDRNVKLPLYARSGIAEVWIVNIAEDVVESYWRPEDDEYRERHVAGRDETVAAHGVAELELAVAEMLG